MMESTKIKPVCVYIVEAKNGLCKIGCSKVPVQRAEMIHTHSPIPVRLVAQWPGGHAEERALHLRFNEYRDHNEWFRLEGEVALFVDERRGIGVEIVEWSQITWQSSVEKRAAFHARIARIMKQHWADPEYRKRRAEDRARDKAARIRRSTSAGGVKATTSA